MVNTDQILCWMDKCETWRKKRKLRVLEPGEWGQWERDWKIEEENLDLCKNHGQAREEAEMEEDEKEELILSRH